MIEIQIFGWLLVTLPTAPSVVLLLVALTSVTYLAMTLAPVLGAGPGSQRGARTLGVATATGTLALAVLGLRVGAAGAGGELIPTLAVSVAAAAASGASAAFALLGAGAAVARLGAAGARRRAEIADSRAREQKLLEASQRAFFEAEDLRAEVDGAEAALARLGAALDKLASTHTTLVDRLFALDDAALAGDLGRELARTRDEVRARLDLGRRIHGAAEGAAFRLACSAPVRRLLRRRPRDLTRGITATLDSATATARVSAAVAAIEEFLHEADGTRTALTALESRRFQRPDPDDTDDTDPGDRATAPEDAWALAMRDLAAIEDAYVAVQERLGVVAMRFDARTDMEEVASAAGEVSDKARASGIPATDLQGLVDEVTRAESAIRMATPPELDAHALTDALARSATALGGNDGASLDELLRALREVA